jgi:hypothetical protein
MKEKDKHIAPNLMKGKEKKNNSEGYPLYPESEDIYSKFHKEKNINPEDTSKTKEPNKDKDTNDAISAIDLDVPGSELDDDQEKIGSEDEENNYYSLGGDDHNDLDEYKGL